MCISSIAERRMAEKMERSGKPRSLLKGYIEVYRVVQKQMETK